jgi:alkylhydroperoxidase family enzyme
VGAVLTALLKPAAVSSETLHDRYGALLELVRKLIGVVPNCDAYLEIWPPAFRVYNVMVPNLLNLPLSLWGLAAPLETVGLAMYTASRTAECAYCSAHTCSFAVRRGGKRDRIARALSDDPDRSPAEQAVIAVARGLATVPASIGEGERTEILRHFSAADVEWIVLGVGMIGWLAKFMDAVGVELEADCVADVDGILSPSGWTPGKHGSGGAAPRPGLGPEPDTLGTKLGVIPLLPKALAFERPLMRGVPTATADIQRYVKERVGHDFPLLARLRHKRAVRTIAVLLRETFAGEGTRLGPETKALVAMVYAAHARSPALERDASRLAEHHGASASRLDEVRRFASGEGDLTSFDPKTRAALALARCIAPSPAALDDRVVDEARALQPAAIVETVVTAAMMQLLGRVGAFYPGD